MNGHSFCATVCTQCGIAKADFFYSRDMYLFGGTNRAMNRNECLGVRCEPE